MADFGPFAEPRFKYVFLCRYCGKWLPEAAVLGGPPSPPPTSGGSELAGVKSVLDKPLAHEGKGGA